MPKVEPHSRIFSMAAALDGGFGGVVTGGPSSVLRVCDDALNECQRPAASSQHRFLGKAPGKVEKAIINVLSPLHHDHVGQRLHRALKLLTPLPDQLALLVVERLSQDSPCASAPLAPSRDATLRCFVFGRKSDSRLV
jgi:hypothetical protein